MINWLKRGQDRKAEAQRRLEVSRALGFCREDSYGQPLNDIAHMTVEGLERMFLPSGEEPDYREYAEDLQLATDDEVRDMVRAVLGDRFDAVTRLEMCAEEINQRRI